jgi:hypothetical protein
MITLALCSPLSPGGGISGKSFLNHAPSGGQGNCENEIPVKNMYFILTFPRISTLCMSKVNTVNNLSKEKIYGKDVL